MGDIERRINAICCRIADAAERAGRSPRSIDLMAVTKTVEPQRIDKALKAGIAILGENRAQEAEQKMPLVGGGASWHFIGKLQSNKASLAARLFDSVHSVDRASLVARLQAAAIRRRQPLGVYAQIDFVRRSAADAEIFESALGICTAVQACQHLELCGLMTLPPYDPDPENARPFFRRLRKLRNQLRDTNGELRLPGLSMGMTGDFEVAIEEGSTIVRVGSAIFGPRARPQP